MTRRHQANVAPEHPLEHRRHQRIVGTPEDQGVDARLAQRGAVRADRLDHLLVERKPVLDDRSEPRRRDLDDVELRVSRRFLERDPVGTALDRRRRREHPDPV